MQQARTDGRSARRYLAIALAAGAVHFAPNPLQTRAMAAPAAAPAANDVDPAAKKLLKASGLFNSGLFKLAGQEYAEFLQQFPTHADATGARYALALCHYRQGENDQAIQQLAQVLKDPKFDQRDEALAVLGHCQLEAKHRDLALAAFDELLAKYPKSKHAEVASLNRAQVLYLDGKYKEAGAAAASYLKDYPQAADRPAGLYFLALSQKALDQNDAAAATLVDLIAKHPQSKYQLDAILLLGQSLEAQNKLDAAADAYRKMLAAAPAARQADARYSLGAVLSKAGKYDEAAKELSAVVTDTPDSPYARPARLQLGLVQLAAGKTAAARQTLTAALKDDPTSAAARYGLAQTDIADRKFDSALATLDDLLKQNPPPANVQQVALDRAVCLAELGRNEEATRDFAAFAKQYANTPQAAEAQYRQAFSLHKLAKYAESHALASEVARGKSEFAIPAAELDAENLFLAADYKGAAQAFDVLRTAAKDEDKKTRYTFRLGQCAYFAGDYGKAVALLQSVADDPKAGKDEALARAPFLLGDALLQQGKYAEATAALQKYAATAGKGDRQEAQFKLALAQLRSDQAAAAEKNLQAVATGPADSPWTTRALFELGQFAYRQQPPQGERAAAYLTKALAAKPPAEIAGPATYLLGWVDFDAKRYADAAAKWKDVSTNYPKDPLAPDAAFQQGVALKEAGKNDEALAALQAYAKAYPDTPNAIKARQLAAAVLSTLGRDAEAKTMLGQLASEKASDTVLYDLAWSQKGTKDAAGAADTYRRLLKEFPDSKLAPAARTELAELLYGDKKYDEAVPLLAGVTDAKDPKAIDPKVLASAQYLLGWCYDKQGKAEQAAVLFTQYANNAAAEPDRSAAALLQAGVALASKNHYDEAAKSLRAMLQKYPQHKDAAIALLKLGEVEADAGNFDAALKADQDFIQKYPTSEFAYRAQFGIGWALENQKKYDDARKAYAKVIAATNGETAARAQFQTGETLLAENKFEEAVKELLAVDFVYAYPKWSARALLEAGRAFEQMKQPDQAKQQYTQLTTKYKDQPEAEVAQARLKALASAPTPPGRGPG